MNLLLDPWIPVRGAAGFRELRFEELLCRDGEWHLSLPRDDLELACLQLLVCLTQVLFPPPDVRALRARIKSPLPSDEFAAAIEPVREWFDLDHPVWPFMQSRGVKAAEVTPIQKLLIGLPEGNNHAFFNEPGEVKHLGAATCAIALFNQASNCPSFGGGFKGSLRGGAPITTLVAGGSLRETVWRNVLTRKRLLDRFPDFDGDLTHDRPTWVEPIKAGETIQESDIGLLRGLFWQPARVELVRADDGAAECDLLGGSVGATYVGFRKEKFGFTVDGVWPHPHGAMTLMEKKGQLEQRFSSFTTTAPAWTQLSQFVIPRRVSEAGEGHTPAGPVSQFGEELYPARPLHLMVGGYRANQASVVERRHEFFSIAHGWAQHADDLEKLVNLALQARKLLRGKLYYAVQGHKDKGLQGIGADIHKVGDELFYRGTEALIHATLSEASFEEFPANRDALAAELAKHCEAIFEQLTDPYARKPELIPIIALARRGLSSELRKLHGGVVNDGR